MPLPHTPGPIAVTIAVPEWQGRSAKAVAAPAGVTRAIKSRWPPFSKKPRTAYGRKRAAFAVGTRLKKPPYQRWYSVQLVTGRGTIGPRSVWPAMPAVLVLTPSIGRGPLPASST